jgi:hypothetical protein
MKNSFLPSQLLAFIYNKDINQSKLSILADPIFNSNSHDTTVEEDKRVSGSKNRKNTTRTLKVSTVIKPEL